MSLDAIRWAWGLRIQKTTGVSRSAVKLTLQSMADRADDDFECFPSIARLEFDTQLNRKTIHAALRFLESQKIIEDTGRRKGKSGKVKVYKLLGVPSRDQEFNSPKSGPITKSNSSENCKDKQSQIGDSPKSGIIPNLPEDSPESGSIRQSQIWDKEPISNNLSVEPKNLCAFSGENPLADDENERAEDQPDPEHNETSERDAAEPEHEKTESPPDDSPEPVSDAWVSSTGKKLSPGEQKIFSTLWDAYGHKKSRATAVDQFLKVIKPYFGRCKETNQKNLNHFLAAIEYSKQLRADHPDVTPLYFERWIKQRRWEDYEQRTDDAKHRACYTNVSDEEKAQMARPMWERKGFGSLEAFQDYISIANQLSDLEALNKPTFPNKRLMEQLRQRLKEMNAKRKHPEPVPEATENA